jgi:hypothetical protein
MTKKSWLKERTIQPFGEDSDPITIRITETQNKGALGSYDPQKGELRVSPGQSPEQQLVILIHELLHFVETCLLVEGHIKRAINHNFITNGAYGLAATLVHSGVIKGITPAAWDAFWVKQRELEG